MITLLVNPRARLTDADRARIEVAVRVYNGRTGATAIE
jgi:hypothetical protein